VAAGTEGSNLASSSAESGANSDSPARLARRLAREMADIVGTDYAGIGTDQFEVRGCVAITPAGST